MKLTRQPSDLKSRLLTCLNKLSDRDTLQLASSELESIAKSLSDDNFSPFLTCLSGTDSAEKFPVRRQCVRLITVLSAAHGDALSPHLSKLLSSVVRRLRDPDSAVRSACVDAVASISSHITTPPFSSILRPLLDCIFHEQDQNAQIGASLCLAAAVEAAPEPDTAELKKLLPKLFKLARNDCFKAKPALLSLIGSIVNIGAALSKSLLNNLIPCVVEFLSSEDWTARKAAAETLVKLAAAEKDLLAEHKSCLASIESRKFDKVKVVRETMNRALEMWKEILEASDTQSQSKSSSSSTDSITGEDFPVVSTSSCDSGYWTPQRKKPAMFRSYSTLNNSSVSSSKQRRGMIKSDSRKLNAARSSKAELKGSSQWKIESDVPFAAPSKVSQEDIEKNKNISSVNPVESEHGCNLKVEQEQVLPPKASDHKLTAVNNLRSRSRVVPSCDNENAKANVVERDNNACEDYVGSQKEFEDFSLVCKQLVQIENQQSNLLELLQRFIGNSQRGMNSLEKRVSGLEKVLDEMSHDLGISTQRVSDTGFAGEEFLSPRFWRKAEGQNTTKYSFLYRSQSMNTVMYNMSFRASNPETTKLERSSTHQHYEGHV